MKTKNVEAIINPRSPHWVGDGFRVHNFIPSNPKMSMARMDPFILLDYNSKFAFPASNKPKGVGVHPHRGFETVTIAYKGKVAHHDSSGNSGIIGEGDVQWMTAASGILHKEYHEEEFNKKGGDFQMVQLWVNLPAKYKMSKPKYQGIIKEEIPISELPNNAGKVEVIAGNYNGIQGKASTFSPLNMLNAKLVKGGKATFNFPENYNTVLLAIEGKIKVNQETNLETDQMALMENKGETFEIEATDNALILVLSGEPLNEPIASQGPFVMNTREELMQAFQDFNTGKFGYLED